MTIAIGDQVPDVKVFTFGDKGPEATTSAEVLGHGKVVLFGVPGAFTPTCSDHHLPGFVMRAEDPARFGIVEDMAQRLFHASGGFVQLLGRHSEAG